NSTYPRCQTSVPQICHDRRPTVLVCSLRPSSLTFPSRTASPCPIRSPGSRSAPRTAFREQGDRPHDADCHILEREPEGRLQTPCVIVSILEDPDRVVERHEPLTNQVVVDSAAEDRGPEQDPLVAESIGKMSKSRALPQIGRASCR